MVNLKKASALSALALVALILLASLGAGSSAAASVNANGNSAGASTYCTALFPTSGSSLILSQGAALSGVISISVIIILVMALIAAAVYMVGRSFGLDKALNFGKSELVEVFITAIIIAIFIGVLAVGSYLSASASGSAALSSFLPTSIFTNVCTNLYGAGISATGNLFVIGVDQVFLSLLSSVQVSVISKGYGFSFSPLIGYALLSKVLNEMTLFSSGMIALTFGMDSFLSLVYGLFPLFLYVGIALRTIPWTRPAGGSFLALFVGFFIFFPLMLNGMLAANPALVYTNAAGGGATTGAPAMNPLCSTSTGGSSAPAGSACPTGTSGATAASAGAAASGYLSGIFKAIGSVMGLVSCNSPFAAGSTGQCIFSAAVVDLVEPMTYMLIAIILTFLFTLGFVAAFASALGAPSLDVKGIIRHFA